MGLEAKQKYGGYRDGGEKDLILSQYRQVIEIYN